MPPISLAKSVWLQAFEIFFWGGAQVAILVGRLWYRPGKLIGTCAFFISR
jgi:hypothetical protein